jgi:hypothetical protein
MKVIYLGESEKATTLMTFAVAVEMWEEVEFDHLAKSTFNLTLTTTLTLGL